MRSKSPLAMMEQVVMVLVFALAAALCLQVFAFSDRMSSRHADVDAAVTRCQSTAEVLKGCEGDWVQAALLLDAAVAAREDALYILYDRDWSQTKETDAAAYVLRARRTAAPVAGLGAAEVWAEPLDGSGESLFSLTVAWQEVSHGE